MEAGKRITVLWGQDAPRARLEALLDAWLRSTLLGTALLILSAGPLPIAYARFLLSHYVYIYNDSFIISCDRCATFTAGRYI